MMLFRLAHRTDLDAMLQLAEHAGVGMTTLPKDKELLSKRLKWACDSFKKAVTTPADEYYLFVLEDVSTGQVVGLSGIEASIGHDLPFYSYKLSKRTRICHSLGIRSDYEILNLVNDNQGRTEICTLFLEANYRHSNNGPLLSRSRFLFMANQPTRFAPFVIAEMRGISDDSGYSPFWENVGKHFFHMPFIEADRLTLSTDKQFIADLMPRNPLYVKLLSPEAQAVIGTPHPSTVPALNILKREGFRYNFYVDIFDAGPTLEVARDQIRTIVESRVLTVQGVKDDMDAKPFLLSNVDLNFRSTFGHVHVNEQRGTCVINQITSELLQVKPGDLIRVAPLHIEDKSALSEHHEKT